MHGSFLREVEQHHRPEWHCIQALLPEQAAQQMGVPLGRRLPRRCSGTVFRTVPFRLSRSQTVWHRPHGVPAQFVAARGKSAGRRTEMFVWQQVNKSRSVGPSGRATKLEQKTTVFPDNIDLSRGGTMHVLSPHKRKVSNPVSNEEAREAASVCTLKHPIVHECALASSKTSAHMVETSHRCRMTGMMQSFCETSPWDSTEGQPPTLPSTSRSQPPTRRAPSSSMSSSPAGCYRHFSRNTLPL